MEKSQHFFFSPWRVSQAVFPTLLLLLPRIALRGLVEGQASSSPPTSLTVLESCSRRYQRRRGCGPRTRMSSATALRSGCRAVVPTVPGPDGSGRRDRLVPSLYMCFAMVSRSFLVMFDLAFLGHPFGAWLLLSIPSRGNECSMPACQLVMATTDLPTFSSTFHHLPLARVSKPLCRRPSTSRML